MDFYWGGVPTIVTRDNGRNDTLYMSGEIHSGDYERFIEFMSKDMLKYADSPKLMVLASNGGDLVEALKIAELLKQMFFNVYVLDAKCASACFFLYLSGTYRYARPGLLGIHRAYFDPRYFAGLSASEAQKRQAALTQATRNVLDESGVPQYLIEKMNQTSSAQVYWLDDEDLDRIGSRPAWYEELMIAKCGFNKRLEETFMNTPKHATQYNSISAAYKADVYRVALCEDTDIVQPELKKLQARLRSERTQRQAK
jgi:hypothetical protein